MGIDFFRVGPPKLLTRRVSSAQTLFPLSISSWSSSLETSLRRNLVFLLELMLMHANKNCARFDWSEASAKDFHLRLSLDGGRWSGVLNYFNTTDTKN